MLVHSPRWSPPFAPTDALWPFRPVTASSDQLPSMPSRQVVPQNGSDPLQRPVDLIAGDHEWRGDADRVSVGILGKNPPALQRFTIATRIASFRVEFNRESVNAPAFHGSYWSGCSLDHRGNARPARPRPNLSSSWRTFSLNCRNGKEARLLHRQFWNG
jgi:hypothetical protein